jgi:hypothetical protein
LAISYWNFKLPDISRGVAVVSPKSISRSSGLVFSVSCAREEVKIWGIKKMHTIRNVMVENCFVLIFNITTTISIYTHHKIVFGKNRKLFCPSKVLGAFCPGKVLGVFQSGDNCNQDLVFEKNNTNNM